MKICSIFVNFQLRQFRFKAIEGDNLSFRLPLILQKLKIEL